MKKDHQTMSTYDPLPSMGPIKRGFYFLNKLLIYTVRYLTRPGYLFTYITKSLDKDYKETVRFMSDQTFLDTAQEKSTIRIGDGEFGMIIDRKNIHFQAADPILLQKLEELIVNYTDQSPYLLGINPPVVIPNKVLARHDMKFQYMQQKLGYRLYCDNSSHYFNASYFYLSNTAYDFMTRTSLDKNVIVVTNHDNIKLLKEKSSRFFNQTRSVHFIENSNQNAFSSYDQTLQEILSKAQENTVVFTANGPAGKVLVYELATIHKVLAHDIGHGLRFSLREEVQESTINWEVVRPYFLKAIS